MIDLQQYIRDVPDFPKKGIIFKDITPLLASHDALSEAVIQLAAPFADKGVNVVVGIESRGFIFGSLLADHLAASFVPIRKPGKLPCETISASYELEYGTDKVEIHADAISPGQKVLMVDDLLATGGTMSAGCELVNKLGGEIVGLAFLVELCFLNGRDRLGGYQLHSLIEVAGE